MQSSHNTWGRGKDIAPTTWGADWDSCSTADHVGIILDFSPCHIQEALVITMWKVVEIEARKARIAKAKEKWKIGRRRRRDEEAHDIEVTWCDVIRPRMW